MLHTALIIILLIFIFLAFTLGINRAIASLPFLLFFLVLILFVGYFFVPIVIILLIGYLVNKNRPKTTRRTYYYKWDNSNTQNFEDFFRDATGSYGGYQQNNGYYRNANNPFGYTEDLTKYYQILGVSKDATKDEIKKVYRDLVKQHHPDKFANNPKEKEYHENKLKEINEAYEKLVKE